MKRKNLVNKLTGEVMDEFFINEENEKVFHIRCTEGHTWRNVILEEGTLEKFPSIPFPLFSKKYEECIAYIDKRDYSIPYDKPLEFIKRRLDNIIGIFKIDNMPFEFSGAHQRHMEEKIKSQELFIQLLKDVEEENQRIIDKYSECEDEEETE